MNVIVFGARIIGASLAYELADAFINAKFIANEERFTRRFNKVKAIETKYMCGQGSTSPA
jgi:ribose 5-phosphate isomerase B